MALDILNDVLDGRVEEFASYGYFKDRFTYTRYRSSKLWELIDLDTGVETEIDLISLENDKVENYYMISHYIKSSKVSRDLYNQKILPNVWYSKRDSYLIKLNKMWVMLDRVGYIISDKIEWVT